MLRDLLHGNLLPSRPILVLKIAESRIPGQECAQDIQNDIFDARLLG